MILLNIMRVCTTDNVIAGKTRAFIAIDIPERIKKELSAVDFGDVEGLKPVGSSSMHITIFFLGYITEQQIAKVISAMDSISMRKFAIGIKGIGVFTQSDPRVIYAAINEGRSEISSIFDGMRSYIASCCRIESRAFVPHVTIARIKHQSSSNAEAANRLASAYKSKDFGIFECDSIKLKKSVLGESGPSYSNIYIKAFS
ncbi:MAG: RNA 2',3'-cyclic phosphodiesterase [Candidatus Micrarchaeaceae archaeon]